MIEISQFTVKNLLVQEIRKEIICSNFVPGERLPLRDLAARFNVSTQPIREALSELEKEGLVTSEPRKGAVVTKLSTDELQDIYEVRATLEAMATELAIPHLTAGILTKLGDLVQQMDDHIDDIFESVELNTRFHLTLYQASKRSHLCELIQSLRHRTSHYLHAYIVGQNRMVLAQDEHLKIIDACRSDDALTAKRLMHEHVLKAGKGIIDYIKSKQTEESNH
ncbi:MAG: GntR family transcriptional regulator [Anaerolineae bacterium]